MDLKPKDDYRGFGQADPNKTRAQRAAQLQMCLSTEFGTDLIEYYVMKYTNKLVGTMGNGAVALDVILRHEYPGG